VKTRLITRPWVAAIVILATATAARAQNVITNGGFEGGFTGWIRADQLGSEGTFALQSGTTSPVNGMAVPAAPGGTQAAMTDAQGPGAHVLYQDFVVPSSPIGSAPLSFSVFVGNRATAFSTPASLDFSTPTLNQQARVDILRGGTDPFSVSAADVLFTAYQTQIADPLVSGYSTVTRDLTSVLAANPGATLRLRFAETDNVNFFQLGVDNVSLTVSPVPEPSALALVGGAVLVGLRYYRRNSGRNGTVARFGA
jgi:hypothetical protein